MKRMFLSLMALFLLFGLFLPLSASAQGPDEWTGTVMTNELYVRTEPSTSGPLVETLFSGDKVAVVGEVQGEDVDGGYATWYKTVSGYYVYGRYVVQSNGGAGRWIDVDLSKQIATAMVDREPVYTALVAVGRSSNPTPIGVFSILKRVMNETMDSTTIGIPNNAPGGYYLTDVLYTQYFTNEGHALHYNYWVDPAAFGNFPTSHGCIGLMLADAEYFWNFADIGTPVVIHE